MMLKEPRLRIVPLGLIGLLSLLWASTLAAENSFRLGHDVVPTFQEIFLKVDADQPDYEGSVGVELEVKKATSVFHFHSEGPTLTKLRLMHKGEEIAVSHEAQGDDVVKITAENELKPGAYRLEIEFKNAFDTQAVSLYRAPADDIFYTFTQFEADDAREAFPCWDEPSFKIPFQMTLSVPLAHASITNTPEESNVISNGWRTTTFARTPPLPTYLLALATGPFEFVDIPGLGVPARIATVKGRSHLTSLAVEVTPPILKALEEYFDRAYPYKKLDFIAVPEFWPGAMENPGAITYADRLLVVDPASVTVGQRRAQAGVIAHELAHQWFGNLVTMEWWDDLWLNESFADWMADKITHQLFPELATDVSAIGAGNRIMVGDAQDTSVAIRQPVNSTSNLLQDVGLAYSKGKMVLGMFEQWIGEEAFRQGVLAYLKSREWGNATADDLFAALTKASEQPISRAMATFIDQPGVPRIEAEPLGEGKLRLSQERYRVVGSSSPDQEWHIPVVLRYGNSGEGADEVKTRTVVLNKKSQEVDLGSPFDWVHPNAGARGYFRWSLPFDALKALALQGASLDDVERINIVGNSSALLQAGEIDGGSFLDVLTLLARDPEPTVVSSALGQIGLVEAAFVPDDLKPAFSAWVRATLGPSLERFGAEHEDGEPETVTLLRPGLLDLLARHGEESVVADFKKKGESFLADPSSVDPALVPLALELVVADGDLKLFEEMKRRAQEAKTPRLRGLYLGTLSGFEAPDLQKRALSYGLSPEVRPNELFRVIGGFFQSAEGRDLVFQFMLANWEQVTGKLPPPFRAFMPRLADGCSAERLAKAEEFFARPENIVEGTERALSRVRESVTSCVAMRERESASVAAFLKAYEPS